MPEIVEKEADAAVAYADCRIAARSCLLLLIHRPGRVEQLFGRC